MDDLNSVNTSLRSEIEQFRTLRSNLEEFAKEQHADFQSVMKQINGTFDRINSLLFENERVLLMKVHCI